MNPEVKAGVVNILGTILAMALFMIFVLLLCHLAFPSADDAVAKAQAERKAADYNPGATNTSGGTTQEP